MPESDRIDWLKAGLEAHQRQIISALADKVRDAVCEDKSDPRYAGLDWFARWMGGNIGRQPERGAIPEELPAEVVLRAFGRGKVSYDDMAEYRRIWRKLAKAMNDA